MPVKAAEHYSASKHQKRPAALSLADLQTCSRALTVAELSQLFSVDKTVLYRMAREGRIPGAFRIGTCLRFDPRKVAAAFLEVR